MTNFEAIQDRAKTMTVAELSYAIHDCAETAAAMDRIDVDGVDRAGRYRDEASVYRAELASR